MTEFAARSVLLVDDDPQMIASLAAVAQMRTMVVEKAGTMREAMQKMTAQVFTHVFLDLLLPDSDVYETLAQVPVILGFGTRYVILITGTVISPAIEREVLRTGAGTSCL